MKCINLVIPTSSPDNILISLISTLSFLNTLDEYSIFWSFYRNLETEPEKLNEDKLVYLIFSSGIAENVQIDFFLSPELAMICSSCKGRKITFETSHLIFLEDYSSHRVNAGNILNLIQLLGAKTLFLTFNESFISGDLIRLINLGSNNWTRKLTSSLLMDSKIREVESAKELTSLVEKSLFWLCTKCFKGTFQLFHYI
jgi:hypothetical protein